MCLRNLLLLYCLTYKSYKVTFDNLPIPGKIKPFWIIVLTRSTRVITAKFITDSYQCSLFRLHEIHLRTCSNRIPGYCYTHHCHYNCVLRGHTRLYLKQQKESKWKMLNWNGVVTKLLALTNLLLFYCLAYRSYKVTFDNFPIPGKIKRFQMFYRFYVNRQHFLLRSFALLCLNNNYSSSIKENTILNLIRISWLL